MGTVTLAEVVPYAVRRDPAGGTETTALGGEREIAGGGVKSRAALMMKVSQLLAHQANMVARAAMQATSQPAFHCDPVGRSKGGSPGTYAQSFEAQVRVICDRFQETEGDREKAQYHMDLSGGAYKVQNASQDYKIPKNSNGVPQIRRDRRVDKSGNSQTQEESSEKRLPGREEYRPPIQKRWIPKEAYRSRDYHRPREYREQGQKERQDDRLL
ncbi:hypothetical protein AAG570_012442 [Ranatra chinensis]|uniref:Uncharacterized protein n=1 Tax=Ranatra chinensis TaxID=642074 RepID=A0ABD0YE14_9HEMI